MANVFTLPELSPITKRKLRFQNLLEDPDFHPEKHVNKVIDGLFKLYFTSQQFKREVKIKAVLARYERYGNEYDFPLTQVELLEQLNTIREQRISIVDFITEFFDLIELENPVLSWIEPFVICIEQMIQRKITKLEKSGFLMARSLKIELDGSSTSAKEIDNGKGVSILEGATVHPGATIIIGGVRYN
jgi:hypothetical protein